MRDHAFVWRQVALPSSLSPKSARSALLGLASLPGQPRLVLEAIGRDGLVSWRLGAAKHVMPKVSAVLRNHVPDGRLVPTGSSFDGTDDLSAATSVRISRNRHLPLRAVDPTDVTRNLFGVFASTGTSEVLRLQLVLGPRTRPHRGPQIDGVARTLVQAKHGEHGFGCVLRIAAQSGTEVRARELIASAAAALHVLEVPGVAISLCRTSKQSVVAVRSPFLWPLWLSINDLVPLLAWPVTIDPDEDLAGVPPRHPRLMPATRQHGREGRSLGVAGSSLATGSIRRVRLSVADSLRHTHVLGVTGTGKSTLLAQLVLSDITQGRGAVVIDPKGDLVDDILARVPEDRRDDIVVLDARDHSPVGINPLRHVEADLAADSLLAVFRSLYADGWGPRTSDILHASLLTLARRGDASLVMVPLLLTNPGFRRSVVGAQVKADPLGLGSFWATFNGWSDAEREHNIQPLLNKLRQVLLRPSLRGIFGQRHPRFDITDVFTKQRVMLVALGKGTIGPDAAQLLGSILTTHLWHATTQRIQTPVTERKPVMVYIDEVQDYLRLPGDLGDALAQARGLGVGFTLAHQELGQLGSIKSAVMANTRSRVIFQAAPADAREMAAAFGDGKLTREDFRALGAFQAYAQPLSGGSTAPWVSLVTEPLPEPRRSAATLRAQSAARYGQPLDAVEADLLTLVQAPAHASTVTGKPDNDHGTPNAPSESLGRRRRPSAPQNKGVQALENTPEGSS